MSDASAKVLIHNIRKDHSKMDAPLDVHTTGGIQRTLAMHWDAICALADMIDGPNDSEVRTRPVESLPVERSYPVEPVPVP